MVDFKSSLDEDVIQKKLNLRKKKVIQKKRQVQRKILAQKRQVREDTTQKKLVLKNQVQVKVVEALK